MSSPSDHKPLNGDGAALCGPRSWGLPVIYDLTRDEVFLVIVMRDMDLPFEMAFRALVDMYNKHRAAKPPPPGP